MDTEEFKIFVTDNSGWFVSDNQETLEDIRFFEQEIGFELPTSIKWLLTEYGYSESCGLDNLSSSVYSTLELRESINLPEDIFILTNWNNDRVALMFAGGSEIICCEMEDVSNFIESGSFPKSIDTFDNYPTWVQYRLEQADKMFEY